MRVRMLVAYDGSGFHGFAAQPGQRTVAGVLGEAIEQVARHPVDLTCAGRTDRGVHAWGQVVSLDLPARVDLDVAAALAGEAVRTRDRRARDRRGGARLRRPLLGHRPHLPLHGAQPAGARSVPGRHVVARAGAARHRAAHAGVRPVPRRARLQRVLPAPEGRSRARSRCRWCGGCAGRVDRPGGGGAALRDRGHRLLPPDGALDRRHRRRRRPRADPSGGHPRDPAGRRPGGAAPIAPPEGLCLWHVSY